MPAARPARSGSACRRQGWRGMIAMPCASRWRSLSSSASSSPAGSGIPRLVVGLQRRGRGGGRGAGQDRCLGDAAGLYASRADPAHRRSRRQPPFRLRRTASWWCASPATPAPRSSPPATSPTRRRHAASPAASPAGVVEKRLTLKGDAGIAVRRGGHDAASFRFAIIADRPPTIAFEGPIKTGGAGRHDADLQGRGRLRRRRRRGAK